MMQQNVIENKFNSDYAPLATIQLGTAIKFTVKCANDLYLDLNNSRLHVLVKITIANGTNIEANTKALIYLTLHAMFREIKLDLIGQNFGDTNQLYPYRSDLETLLNFRTEMKETGLINKKWTKEISAHICVTVVNRNIAGLNTRATKFARIAVVELINRFHLDLFQQKRLIPPNNDLNMRLISSPNDFMCKSAHPA